MGCFVTPSQGYHRLLRVNGAPLNRVRGRNRTLPKISTKIQAIMMLFPSEKLVVLMVNTKASPIIEYFSYEIFWVLWLRGDSTDKREA